jgi:hypothetical protein
MRQCLRCRPSSPFLASSWLDKAAAMRNDHGDLVIQQTAAFAARCSFTDLRLSPWKFWCIYPQ